MKFKVIEFYDFDEFIKWAHNHRVYTLNLSKGGHRVSEEFIWRYSLMSALDKDTQEAAIYVGDEVNIEDRVPAPIVVKRH